MEAVYYIAFKCLNLLRDTTYHQKQTQVNEKYIKNLVSAHDQLLCRRRVAHRANKQTIGANYRPMTSQMTSHMRSHMTQPHLPVSFILKPTKPSKKRGGWEELQQTASITGEKRLSSLKSYFLQLLRLSTTLPPTNGKNKSGRRKYLTYR